MDKQRCFRHALLTVVLGAFGVSGIVTAVDEIELDQSISNAQELPITGGGATVKGWIGVKDDLDVKHIIKDVDFYSFQGTGGDLLTIDIDGGTGGDRHVDTILTVFGPVGTYTMLRQNDDCGGLELDSCIIDLRLEATGSYVVVVSSYPCYPTRVDLTGGGMFFDNGSTSCTPETNGDYTLVISGVTSPVQPINIDIKPGSSALAPVNPKSRGKIPVALLSSSEFNALGVNVASLTFGAKGNEPSLSMCGKNGEDVNGDGRPDLVCHFENQLAKFTPGDLEGIVRGSTTDGRQFEGRGLLKVVPAKRKN